VAKKRTAARTAHTDEVRVEHLTDALERAGRILDAISSALKGMEPRTTVMTARKMTTSRLSSKNKGVLLAGFTRKGCRFDQSCSLAMDIKPGTAIGDEK
jgi:hypothetical protein